MEQHHWQVPHLRVTVPLVLLEVLVLVAKYRYVLLEHFLVQVKACAVVALQDFIVYKGLRLL
jgi:hypothetical protein